MILLFVFAFNQCERILSPVDRAAIVDSGHTLHWQVAVNWSVSREPVKLSNARQLRASSGRRTQIRCEQSHHKASFTLAEIDVLNVNWVQNDQLRICVILSPMSRSRQGHCVPFTQLRFVYTYHQLHRLSAAPFNFLSFCRRLHWAALNPLLYGTNNGETNGTCKMDLLW